MTKIGFGITGSFCVFEKVLIGLKELVDNGYDVYPVVTFNTNDISTRFGSNEEFIKNVEEITGKKVVNTIEGAEAFGSQNKMDAFIVMPATGNFIGKIANGITDNPVLMASKATLRNNKSLLIGISSNDSLGLNGVNIMKLYNTKNVFLIPFSQDDYKNKPNSLISHFDLLLESLKMALNKEQLQPIMREKK
ncbi:MAG: dipicolinate synthase subunit B [Ignavibacteriales bacterium]